jgi:hypothetical protein
VPPAEDTSREAKARDLSLWLPRGRSGGPVGDREHQSEVSADKIREGS